MSFTTEFTSFSRPSRPLLAALVVLWGTFIFFTVCALASKDSASADPARVAELQTAKLAAPTITTHDWPQWRGPNRDGLSRETGLLATWPTDGPRLLWEKPSGEGFSSIAVAQGKAFTMLQENDQEAIVCWDAATGRELWRHRYRAGFRNTYGNGPRATPTIAGDMLFAIGGTGIMTALNISAAQPTVAWTKDLLQEFGAGNLNWGTAYSPLVDGELVFVNPGGSAGRSVAALDQRTGAVRWQALDDAAGYGSPMLADCAGQKQVVFFTNTGLAAVAPESGQLLWRFPWVTEFGANITTPIVAGDYVFISSGYGMGCALLKIEKTHSGLAAKLVYKNKRMITPFTTCVLYDDHLYGFNDTTLTCMEFRTGKVTWRQRGFEKGSLTIADGRLYILGEMGTLALAEATPAQYRELSRFTFAHAKCWTAPVIANGRLYVRNEEKIACYDVRR